MTKMDENFQLKKLTKRGGDCSGAFLSHRECMCYERCARCSVEFELDVNFDQVAPTRPEAEQDLPLTITSRDLVRKKIENYNLYTYIFRLIL